MSRQSANYRELLAVYFALRSFRFSIVGKTVEVLSDNVTTVVSRSYKQIRFIQC